MIRSLFHLGACLFLLAFVFFTHPALSHADNPPRVFAFYYAWFDENSWTPDHVADLPAEPYVSRDPGAMARQIDQAQSAGIDAFVVSWLGPGNPTDERFRAMLDLAGGKGFSATLDFEANRYGSRDALINALTYVRDQLMPHGAFARVNGKPILFFWRQQVRSVEEWAEIRNAVDPNRDQIWIAEGVNVAYQRVFDGHHLYSIAWSRDVNHTLNDWSKRVRRAGADKLWVATVMPGYDDTRTTRADRFARSRAGGEFYRAAWNAAIASRPDLVVITSFNEWVEGSQIEPSQSYGSQYLDLTREFAAQFKSIPPPSAEERLALAATPTPRPTLPPTIAPTVPPKPETRVPLPTPTATPPDEIANEFSGAYRTTDILRVRSGPGTNFEILGKLPRDFVLDVLARSEDSNWLAIAYPDFGSLGWVSAEFVTPQTGFEHLPIEPPVRDEPSNELRSRHENAPALNRAVPPTATPVPPTMHDEMLPVWY